MNVFMLRLLDKKDELAKLVINYVNECIYVENII